MFVGFVRDDTWDTYDGDEIVFLESFVFWSGRDRCVYISVCMSLMTSVFCLFVRLFEKTMTATMKMENMRVE